MPEIIDPVFTKTSPKRSFSVIENECFGVVFAKTGSINSVVKKPHWYLYVSHLVILLIAMYVVCITEFIY